MSVLWTELIEPSVLTGYMRQALADYEYQKGTLARYLPNRNVPDIQVKFAKGQAGLIDIAKFRAFDAEPEIGKRRQADRVTLELPAIGQEIPVSEYEQLRARIGNNITDEQALTTILNTADIAVRAVADAMEYLRGIVLITGIATVAQDNFNMADNFGRAGGHTLTAGSLWSASTATSRLAYLQTIVDTYTDTNGEPPGRIVMSTKILRTMQAGDEFKTQLLNSASRPPTLADTISTIEGAGLPPIEVYDRRVSKAGVTTRVLDETKLLLLPAPVDPFDETGTDLGSTVWGRTLSSTEPGWEIADTEQPGIVAGVYRNPKPPMNLDVVSDAIGEPVLANANRSLAAKVIA